MANETYDLTGNLGVDILTEENSYIVETRVIGYGTDRVRLMGFGLPRTPKGMKLAFRLRDAILAGKVFGPGTILHDANNHSYMQASACIMGRTMNADLKRLGF